MAQNAKHEKKTPTYVYHSWLTHRFTTRRPARNFEIVGRWEICEHDGRDTISYTEMGTAGFPSPQPKGTWLEAHRPRTCQRIHIGSFL